MLKGSGGLKFSTKSRYAIIVLLDLALNGKGHTRSITEISETWGISPKYISRLVIPLRQKGYISSTIGASGGYALEADPQSIRIIDIIDLMDGTFTLCQCILEPESCINFPACKPYPIWSRINQQIRNVFASLTLQELVATYAAPPAGAPTPGKE